VPRYKITIEYDGSQMVGWQRQKEPNSVQQYLEEAIYNFSKENVVVHGCGRTDARVHAYAHVSHFDLDQTYPIITVINALNYYLRIAKIVVLEAEVVDDDFHARFKAKARSYQYLVINRHSPLILEKNRAWHIISPLDEHKMQEGANFLIGKHDFSSFRAKSCQAKSPLRTLEQIKISRDNEKVSFFLKAPSFLHHMVRNIVGTLVYVGNGKLQPDDVKDILEAKNRAAAGPTAPAAGLYFLTADY
jgi:tRNA pseudouridine38-40 synthase